MKIQPQGRVFGPVPIGRRLEIKWEEWDEEEEKEEEVEEEEEKEAEYGRLWVAHHCGAQLLIGAHITLQL